MRAPTAVDEVLEYMRKRRLSLADLVEIGGEDLPGTRAKRVENAWALMARHGLIFANLEQATGDHTVQAPSGRRGEGGTEITE